MAIGTISQFGPEDFSSYRSPSDSFTQGMNSSLELMKNIYATRNEPNRLAAALAMTQQQAAVAQQQARQKQIENQYMAKEKEGDIMKTSLANQLSRLTMPYEVPKMQAQTAELKENVAKSQFNREYPFAGAPGLAGQLEAARWYRNHMPQLPNKVLENNPNIEQVKQLRNPGEKMTITPQEMKGAPGLRLNYADEIEKSAIQQTQNKEAYGDLARAKLTAMPFKDMDVDNKKAALAQLAGIGIGGDEGTRMLEKGELVKDIMKEHGYDNPENYPAPLYVATGEDRKQLNLNKRMDAELNVLNEHITEGMAPYSRRIGDVPIKQILEGISGLNTEGQQRFFAAQALQPELQAIRIRILGGRVSQGLIQEMVRTAMGHVKFIQGLVSPEIYEGAQRLTQQWIEEAVNASSRVAQQTGYNISENQISGNKTKESQPEKRITVVSPDGKEGHIPEYQLNEALASGYKRK